MKKGWEYTNFNNVFPIKMGKTPPRADKASWDTEKKTNNKWVSISDISNNEGQTISDTKEYISDSAAKNIYKVAKGSLLMSFKLSIGRMAFAGDDLYTNEAIIAIPKSEHYLLRFLYYYLSSYNWLSLTEGNEKVKGATLNKQTIGKIKLPVINPTEQQTIVNYLDSAFAKIDAVKANAEKALNDAKALFQAALNEMLKPKEGWDYRLFESCLERVQKPKQVKSKDYKNIGKYPIVSQEAELVSGYWDDESIVFKHEKPVIVFGDHTKNIKFIDFNFVVGADGTQILSPKNDFNEKFFYYALKAIKIRDLGYARHFKLLKEKYIPVPLLCEQNVIATKLDTLKSKVDQLQANCDKITKECEALKQAILKQTFE